MKEHNKNFEQYQEKSAITGDDTSGVGFDTGFDTLRYSTGALWRTATWVITTTGFL